MPERTQENQSANCYFCGRVCYIQRPLWQNGSGRKIHINGENGTACNNCLQAQNFTPRKECKQCNIRCHNDSSYIKEYWQPLEESLPNREYIETRLCEACSRLPEFADHVNADNIFCWHRNCSNQRNLLILTYDEKVIFICNEHRAQDMTNCEWCSREYPIIHTELIQDEAVCATCITNRSFTCDHCEELFPTSNHFNVNDQDLCQACFEEEFDECDSCSETKPINQLMPVSNAWSPTYDPHDIHKICEDCLNISEYHWQVCPIEAVAFNQELHRYYRLTDQIEYNEETFRAGDEISIEAGMELQRQGQWGPEEIPLELINPTGTGTARIYQGIAEVRIDNITDTNHASLNEILYRETEPQRQRDKKDLHRYIVQKIKSRLGRNTEGQIPPTHSRLYTGIELELLEGKWFKTEPYRMLDKELGPNIQTVHDGSIHGNAPGHEFLLPVVKRLSHWQKIQNAIQTLKEFDWKHNESCGLHFHFSKNEISPDNPKGIKNIFRVFYYLEPLIYAAVPPNRLNSRYCQPLGRFFKPEQVEKEVKLDYFYYAKFWKERALRPTHNNPHTINIRRLMPAGTPMDSNIELTREGAMYQHEQRRFGDGKFELAVMNSNKEEHYYPGRYVGFNLHALYKKGTIELRYFPARLEFNFVYLWAKIMEKLILYGLYNKPDIKLLQKITKTAKNPKRAVAELTKLIKLNKKENDFLIKQLKSQGKYEKQKPDLNEGRDLYDGIIPEPSF